MLGNIRVDLLSLRSDAGLLRAVEQGILSETATLLSTSVSRLEMLQLDLDAFSFELRFLPVNGSAAVPAALRRRLAADAPPLQLALQLQSAISNASSPVYTQGQWLRRVDSETLQVQAVSTPGEEGEDDHEAVYITFAVLGGLLVVAVVFITFRQLQQGAPPAAAKKPVDVWRSSRKGAPKTNRPKSPRASESKASGSRKLSARETERLKQQQSVELSEAPSVWMDNPIRGEGDV